MFIHCLRHGITEANQSHRFNGALDDPLTEGQRAILQAVQFDHSRYDGIYCSPLRRAIETARCLKIPHWITEPRIAERHLGIFQGLTAEECHERYPDEFAAFLAFDAEFVIPDGESRGQNLARVLEWVQEVSHRDSPPVRLRQRVLAITHGGTIDFLYRLGKRMPVHGGTQIFASENATLSIFEVHWPDVRLVDFSLGLDT